MSEASSFRDLIGRVRAGDAAATAELVRRYGPAFQRAVQARFNRSRLRRLLDPQDICQMVWAHFFPRMTAGGYEVHEPGQLLALLTVMARNYLIKEVRKLQARRRGGPDRRWESLPEGWADARPGPSQVATFNDLRARVLGLLSPAERQLAEQRADGRTWADLAADGRDTADALRVRLARAYQRVVRRLCPEG